jgi:hypothetical protein
MKASWGRFFRRIATAFLLSGATAWSSAICYAQMAADSASDPVYADGWQDGDNGGTGFSPWDFSSSITFAGTYYGQYTDSSFHAIDDGLQGGTHYSNPFNNIGRAWDIGISPTNNGVPRAGRGFAPLRVGQTLKVVIDNPTARQFFKGYFIRLNGASTGMDGKGVDGNICYGGYACTDPFTNAVVPQVNIGTFEYFTNGEWFVTGTGVNTGVFDTDTAEAGAVFSIKRTGADTFDVVLDSLGGGADFMGSGTFDNPGAPVNWIEFTFFNTPTDTGTPPMTATDFYISSMMVIPEPGSAMLLLLGAGGALLGMARRRSEE